MPNNIIHIKIPKNDNYHRTVTKVSNLSRVKMQIKDLEISVSGKENLSEAYSQFCKEHWHHIRVADQYLKKYSILQHMF